ncbi:MAG: hypothetical protein HYY84_04145 [Deltaproteobacteria bacterium]|nr:hypothetical protein [Deltaproteobacteria bacterium]
MQFNIISIKYIFGLLLFNVGTAEANPILEFPPSSGNFVSPVGPPPYQWRYLNSRYDAEDFEVLTNVLRKSTELAPSLSIYSQIPKGGNCGTSSEALVTGLRDVIPTSWRVQQIWSLDPTNLVGGTEHAITMVSSPNGRHYFVDVYGGYPEMAEAVQHPNSNQYQPRAQEVGNLTSELILRALGNPLFIFTPATGGKNFKGTCPDPREQKRKRLRAVVAIDPNEIVGPPGAGAKRYISNDDALRYTIYFENVASASGPAQTVAVSDPLDAARFDLDSVRLGAITFAGRTLTPASGRAFSTDVDLRPGKNLIVRITGAVDSTAARVTWRFTSIDPKTKLPTADALAGFLNANRTPPEGDGSVSFTVRPRRGLASATELKNRASIVFDESRAIETNEWLNTIDVTPPKSSVIPPADTAPATTTKVSISWAATDDASGADRYSVFVAEEGGEFRLWKSNVAETSGVFEGEPGKTYRFYSVARDGAGNAEVDEGRAQVTLAISVSARRDEVAVDAGGEPVANADGGTSANHDAGGGGGSSSSSAATSGDAGSSATTGTGGGLLPPPRGGISCALPLAESAPSFFLPLLALALAFAAFARRKLGRRVAPRHSIRS